MIRHSGARPPARLSASSTRYGREPGIQRLAPNLHLDSGSGAARRPGMTAEI
jgi:hypothetical protein